jgi:hypothetical protein
MTFKEKGSPKFLGEAELRDVPPLRKGKLTAEQLRPCEEMDAGREGREC